MIQSDMTPRALAKLAGSYKYSTGKACRNGHTAERYTKNGRCFECEKVLYRHKRATDPSFSERVRNTNREYHKQHPGLSGARLAAWRRANPAANRAICQNRRTRQKGHKITKGDIEWILKSQRRRCAYCRIKLDGSFHLDHIEPLARGGLNIKRNIQICCQPCNNKKHAKDPVTFARSVGLLI